MQTFFRTLLFVVLPLSFAVATELTPVAVWTDGEVLSDAKLVRTIDKMIDGNPDTYAAILDDMRTGGRADTVPPYADAPVSGGFVLDLGEAKKCVGIRFVAPDGWRALGPKKVRIWSADDPQGKTGLRLLADVGNLPPKNFRYSVCVTWTETEARYLSVRIDESHQHRSPPGALQQRRTDYPFKETYHDLQIAEVRVLTELPDDDGHSNKPDVAFPPDRLRKDWIMQDFGLDTESCFKNVENSDVERAMVEKALQGVKEPSKVEAFRNKMNTFLNAPGNDPRWKALYFSVCEQRRQDRLAYLRQKTDKIAYTKHYLFGGSTGLSPQAFVSDEQYHDRNSEFRVGSQLCLVTLRDDCGLDHEVLLEQPNGVIRDANISFDGKTLIFALRSSFTDDDYHLYTMTLADRKVRQLTFAPKHEKFRCADIEPCFLPSGDIVFASTRHVQIND